MSQKSMYDNIPKLVSIVLPTYNGERYLADSIESVLRQTYQYWELVIVNDCSTDSTPEIISTYLKKDSRIRCIDNTTNQKLPKSLNIGFRETNGEYLTWTSDDNFFHPQAIERMTSTLRSHPKIGLVHANYVGIDQNGYYVNHFQAKDSKGNSNQIEHGGVVGACFMYRRSVYESIGEYNHEFFLAEDYEYWLRAFENYEFMPIPEDLYFYRLQPKSLTMTHSFQALQAPLYRAVQSHILKLKQIPAKLRAKVLIELFRSTGAAPMQSISLIFRLSPRLCLKRLPQLISTLVQGPKRHCPPLQNHLNLIP